MVILAWAGLGIVLPLTSDTCLQYSQSFSTCPRTGPTWCNAALSTINAQNNSVSSIELVWLCLSARTPRHIQCTKHSSALNDSKAQTLWSIFGKFNISAAMCRTGNLKTGKSQNHQFSGNKSPGKYTRYTVFVLLYRTTPLTPGHLKSMTSWNLQTHLGSAISKQQVYRADHAGISYLFYHTKPRMISTWLRFYYFL